MNRDFRLEVLIQSLQQHLSVNKDGRIGVSVESCQWKSLKSGSGCEYLSTN
jgi:hypothetical protein